MTQGAGPLCQWKMGGEGADAGAGAGAGWAAAFYARWAEKKKEGERFCAFRPISREREEEKNKSFLLFLFKANFKFILKSV